MPLKKLADEYLKTINQIKDKIENLNISLATTNNLETKRKLRDKILSYEGSLRQNIVTYQYVKNYYNKEAKISAWI